MDSLKDKLINTAHAKEICEDGYKKLLIAKDKREMVDYYLTIPDWCLERDFPDLQILRDHFSDFEEMGIFVDRVFNGETLSGRQTYIFHHCKGTIKVAMDYKNAVIPMIYLANKCRLRITCDQKENKGKPIIVPVYVFGKNDFRARTNNYAIFRIYKNDLV